MLSRGIVGGFVPDHYDRERFVATLGEAATPMPVKTRAASQERERRAGVGGQVRLATVDAHAKTSAARS